MPVNSRHLEGMFFGSGGKLEDIKQRLNRLNCLVSLDQLKSYLDGSGKTPSDLVSMSDTQLRAWFSSCLDKVYNRYKIVKPPPIAN